jgi:hypothetical protein
LIVRVSLGLLPKVVRYTIHPGHHVCEVVLIERLDVPGRGSV